MALQVGSIIQNKYRIEELLGNGSIGQVFRGRHLALKKQVAIKVLRAENTHRPDVVARFEREALVGAHVVHPNIAAAMDLGQLEDGARFLVLELVRGVTLRDIIRQGPLSPRRAARVGLGIARALECLHNAGIVHRDLKPANVMLVDGDEGLTKLIDFGLARINDESELLSELSGNSGSWDTITTEGQFLGTIAYVAPEVRHGMDAIGASADLYALGVLLFEMLAGRRPFVANAPAEVLRKQLLEPPPPIDSLLQEPLPAAFPPLIHQLLAKEPEQRPSSTEVVQRLEEIAQILGDNSTRPRPSMADWEATGQVVLPGPDLMVPEESSLPEPASTVRDPVPLFPDPPASGAPSRRKGPTALLLGLLFVVGVGLGLRAVSGIRPAPASAGVASGSVSSSASAPAPPAAAPSATQEGPGIPPELRALAEQGDWPALQQRLLALGATAPEIYRAPAVQELITQDAIGLSKKAPLVLQRLCLHLATRPSGDGADALYALHLIPGNSVLFFRSKEGLVRSIKDGTASPKLRLTLDLLWSPCAQKLPLIARAAAEGDERTRHQLDALRTTECARRGGCCLKQLPQLAEAIDQLDKRQATSGSAP